MVVDPLADAEGSTLHHCSAGLIPWVLALALYVPALSGQAANTVYANPAVAGAKASTGNALVTIPDVCKAPSAPATPPGVPVPYPNIPQATDTGNGSAKIKLSNGDEIEIKAKGASVKPGEPNTTIRTQGKLVPATYSFDIKLPPTSAGAGTGKSPSETDTAEATATQSTVPVLQTTDGRAFVLCGDALYAATLFAPVPASVEYIDPPPFEGPVLTYGVDGLPSAEEVAEYRANAEEIERQNLENIEKDAVEYGKQYEAILAKTAPQRAAVDARIAAYRSANPEFRGYPTTTVIEDRGPDGLYTGEIRVLYGTSFATMYIARFDNQGNLIEGPTITPTGQALQIATAHTPAGSRMEQEFRTDINGDKYVAKVIYTNGGGYWLFNENGKDYWGEVYDTETGQRTGSLYEPKNYPALADHGTSLETQPFVQLAQSPCPMQCLAFVDVHNAIAGEMNVIIREMNMHAQEHAATNAPAQQAEDQYDKYLKARDYDEKLGPAPGTPAHSSVTARNRGRYEELQKVLSGFKIKLQEARANLAACRCDGQRPDPVYTAELWGDPYLSRGPAGTDCLSDAARLFSASDSCGSQSSSCSSAFQLKALPSSCSGSPLETWVLTECGASGCEDIAVAAASEWRSGCSGSGYPIGDDWKGFAADACDLARFKPEEMEVGMTRSSQVGETDPAWIAAGGIRPGLEDQWGLHRVMNGAQVGLPAQLDDASPVLVAVIDSGIDLQHPDLLGQIWTNPAEIPGNGIDDDDNGLVDDVNGWNFVANNNDLSDTSGHGTLVAGIIGARSNNGIGIAGANPQVQLMPLKVTNFAGRGNSVGLAAAITYATRAGAKVINISLGGPEFSSAEQSAVDYALQRGVLLVVAAGNYGKHVGEFWPAGLAGVLTVAATEPGDERAPYSNWGSAIDIAAPGSDMLSLRARYTDPMYFGEGDYAPGSNIVGKGGDLYFATGTSFAAPLVSGIASRLFAVHPDLRADGIKQILLNSAQDIGAPGADILTGSGLLDAKAALATDPAFYISAQIREVKVVRADGTPSLEVSGTADASDFEGALVRIGVGEQPESWQTVGDSISQPIMDGVLATFDAKSLAGEDRWTIQLVVKHQNGTQRIAQFDLKLR
ncbi:MAG: S8 family serine peptidase [Halioglobus sp.]